MLNLDVFTSENNEEHNYVKNRINDHIIQIIHVKCQ